MAIGKSNSTIQLWNISKKRKFSKITENEESNNPNNPSSASSLDDLQQTNVNKPSSSAASNPNNPNDTVTESVRLIGHSGGVYGLSFSPCKRFLLSSSQDSTIRLWCVDRHLQVHIYIDRERERTRERDRVLGSYRQVFFLRTTSHTYWKSP